MKNTGGFLPSDGNCGMLHIEVLLLRHDMEERKMPIETPEQKKERQHQEDLRRLQKFRPIDDTFMRGLLKDDIPLAEMILRIILAKPDLILTSCETQADMKRVTGARSVSLDAYGTDSAGKKYDIEIQRASDGADPHRARYHSSVMDVENLDEGQDYKELPDTYVIFIIEKDYYGAGKPVYQIRRINETLNEPFEDGTHILYVNGEYNGDSDIGRLMHDFRCSDADQMHFEQLADKTRYLKQTQKGVDAMCAIMEEIRNESLAEGETRGMIKILAGMVKKKKYTIQEAAAEVNLSENDFIEEAKRLGQF